MGTGEASGDNRAVTAAKDAIFNPLLDDVSLRGAKSLLLSIAGGQDLTLFEVHDAVDCVRRELDSEANIIFGATLDDALTGKIRVSVVASGMHRSEPAADRPANHAADQPHGPPGHRFRPPLSPRAEAAFGRSGAPPSDAARRQERRASGDVVIREKPPQLAGNLPQPTYGNGAAEREPSRVERARRPMPSVEDFPPVGQREYWAKTAGGSRLEPAPPQRKASLFQRLTGGGRDRPGDARQSAERAPGEPLDLPVFFRRDQGT
jgi:cell division protein FtsZ